MNSQNSTLKQFRKWTKDVKRHFTKEGIRISNNHMKGSLASTAIKEIQIKINEISLHTYENG